MIRMLISGMVLGSVATLATGCDQTVTIGIGEGETGGDGGQAGQALATGGAVQANGGTTAAGGARAASGGKATGGDASAGAFASGGETDTGEEMTGEAGRAGASTSRPSPDITCEGSGQRLIADSFGSCLLGEDGELVCWGPEWTKQIPDQPFVSVSIGQDGACGLGPDCRVICWGTGQLANAPPGLYGRQVVTTALEACALDLDGHARCWGVPQPGASFEDRTFSALFDGESAVCGILGGDAEAGDALCWSALSAFTPAAEPGPFVEVGSADHACGRLETGELRCWGNTYYGATEHPSGAFESVITGASHFSCALDADHRASCWGAMYFEDEDPALLDPPDDEFQSLVAGIAHVCGLTLGGEVRCWGYGVASDERGDTPYFGQASPPEGEFVQIAAGFWHTCGLRGDGSVECWGAGQPGDPVEPNGAHKGQSDPPEL
jgi:hypothetical protein